MALVTPPTPDADAFDRLLGLEIDVGEVYDRLTGFGWKIDTEESNLMQGFSRTFRAEGIKLWLFLDEFVCAPPHERGTIAAIRFHRFEPETMPTTSMRECMLAGFDDEDPPGPSWFADWQWLIDHGDPQFDTFDLLTPIELDAVPPGPRAAAWAELHAALGLGTSGREGYPPPRCPVR